MHDKANKLWTEADRLQATLLDGLVKEILTQDCLRDLDWTFRSADGAGKTLTALIVGRPLEKELEAAFGKFGRTSTYLFFDNGIQLYVSKDVLEFRSKKPEFDNLQELLAFGVGYLGMSFRADILLIQAPISGLEETIKRLQSKVRVLKDAVKYAKHT